MATVKIVVLFQITLSTMLVFEGNDHKSSNTIKCQQIFAKAEDRCLNSLYFCLDEYRFSAESTQSLNCIAQIKLPGIGIYTSTVFPRK